MTKQRNGTAADTIEQLRAVYAAELAVAQKQLPELEARATFFVGLSAASEHDRAKSFADAPAARDELRQKIAALEDLCDGLQMASDHLVYEDLAKKLAALATAIEAETQAIAADFPDAEQIARQKHRLGLVRVAGNNGITTNWSEETLFSKKIFDRIAEYDRRNVKVADLRGQAEGLASARDRLRQKYGALADVILPRP